MKRMSFIMIILVLLLPSSVAEAASAFGEQDGYVYIGVPDTTEFVLPSQEGEKHERKYYPFIAQVNQEQRAIRIICKIPGYLTVYSLADYRPVLECQATAGEWIYMDLTGDNQLHIIQLTDLDESWTYSVRINNLVDEYGPFFYFGNVFIRRYYQDWQNSIYAEPEALLVQVGNPHVFWQGEEIDLASAPFEYQGRIYVPWKLIEKMGGSASFDVQGISIVFVDSVAVRMTSEGELSMESFYPMRLFDDVFDWEISWFQHLKIVKAVPKVIGVE